MYDRTEADSVDVGISDIVKDTKLGDISIRVGSALMLMESDFKTPAKDTVIVGEPMYVKHMINNPKYRDRFFLKLKDCYLMNDNSQIRLNPVKE